MADPTILSHTTPYARRTLESVMRYVSYLVGRRYTDLDTDETAILKEMVNAAQNEARVLAPGAKRWGEGETTITWVSGDTRVELPADYAKIRGGHLWKLGDSGDPEGQVVIVEREDFFDSFQEEESYFESFPDSSPIAMIYQEGATNRRRILRIFPTPTAGDQFKLLYWTLVETLSATSDVIEAPPEFLELIQFRAAVKWLAPRNEAEKVLLYQQLAKEQENLLRLPSNREVPKFKRAVNFDERSVGGYPGFKQGTPIYGPFDRFTTRS